MKLIEESRWALTENDLREARSFGDARERAAIVQWLRRVQERLTGDNAEMVRLIAEAIEAGDHHR